MKQAADRKVTELNNYLKSKPPEGPEKAIALRLRNIAETFGQAQYHRNEADYNIAREWNSTEVLLHIDLIADAFEAWNLIREDPAAQAYLVSMLPSKERRQADRPRTA